MPAPDAIDALDADPPAFVDEQLADASIAIAAILLGEPHNVVGERCFIVAHFRRSPLRRARLSDDHARRRSAREVRAHVIHAAACGKGSVFSRQSFLQDQLVEREFRHRLLQPLVLALKFLQALRLIHL